MTDTPEYAALIGSRICHDLISPIGAIGNGLELMELSGGGAGPELQLITESVGNANARIRFFRVAFGLASPEQIIGTAEVLSVLDGLAPGSRVQIDWAVQENVPRPELRLAFLAILCLEATLPLGGYITVSRAGPGWHLHGEGARLRVEPTLWDPIQQGRAPDDLSPADVQFGLLPLVAAAQDRRVTARFSDSVDLTF